MIPLTFLTVEAWSFLQLGARQESRAPTAFPHRWAVMFLVAVGFWNFLGAGIFGFLINLPIVSYYEIGTALTANHGHAAMMGVYGMLAVGLALFCLRYLIPRSRWPDKSAKICFWSLNIGLAWMCFATLFPLGILQLYKSVNDGYLSARTLEFLTNDTNVIEWLRLPGDVVFIVGGALPFLWIAWRAITGGRKSSPPDDVDDTELYTVIEASAGASPERGAGDGVGPETQAPISRTRWRGGTGAGDDRPRPRPVRRPPGCASTLCGCGAPHAGRRSRPPRHRLPVARRSPTRVAGPACPSMLSRGSHSSQRGRYQFQSPSSSIAAGTSTMRTSVASSSTATARPKPICWNITRSPLAKPANTATMISAAPVMMPAVEPTP